MYVLIKVSFHMVLTYEAYVIHYASSSQPVTMLCLSVESFCGPCKGRIKGEIWLKCELKVPPALAYLNNIGFEHFFYWLENEVVWISNLFRVLCSRRKVSQGFVFLLPTAEDMCTLCLSAVLLQHEGRKSALCCKKTEKKTWNCILIHKGDIVLTVE